MLTICIPFLLCFELITDMYLAKIFIQVESKNLDIKMMLGVGTSFAAHSSCSSPDHTSRARESGMSRLVVFYPEETLNKFYFSLPVIIN